MANLGVKLWINTERGESLQIKYTAQDVSETADGTVYTIKPWSLIKQGYTGAGFVTDDNHLVVITRGTNPDDYYNPMLRVVDTIITGE